MPRSRLAIPAAAFVFALVAAGPAFAHGYTESPASRSARCAAGEVTDCGAIQWEPQSVEGPKGFPAAGPADGSICSAGHDNFATLDDPRDGGWPATSVTSGQDITFTWKITAAHSTTSFRYFVTKDSYDPTQPLTRDDLEPEPFLAKDYGGARPSSSEAHSGSLPTGKTGKHLILAVWDIADTANAFYSCADVNFGGTTASSVNKASSNQATAAKAAKAAIASEPKLTTHQHPAAPKTGQEAPAPQVESKAKPQDGGAAVSKPSEGSTEKTTEGTTKKTTGAVLANASHEEHSGGFDASALVLSGAVGVLIGGGIMAFRRRPKDARHSA